MVIKEDLSRNFGYILHDVARLLRTTFDRRVKGMGLTRSQWWVLLHVFRNDGVTQSELADILEIEKATLGRLIDRLETNGWLRRESDANDRRAKRIHLTQAVEPAMKTMRLAAAELRRDALAGLSAEQQERFVDTLLAVKNNLMKSESGAANGTRNGGRQAALAAARAANGARAGAANGARAGVAVGTRAGAADRATLPPRLANGTSASGHTSGSMRASVAAAPANGRRAKA